MPYRSEKAALEATCKAWRALAILSALDKIDPGVVRSRLLVWLIRAPEAPELDALIKEAQVACIDAGWVAADPEEPQVEFATIDARGKKSNVRSIKNSDIKRCPHTILVPTHYRQDGSCRCDDPNNPEMEEWGYTWNGQHWTA